MALLGGGGSLFGLCVCVALFFREPTRREYRSDPDTVFSVPTVRWLSSKRSSRGSTWKERCLQLSVFMSITNVHANWYPVGGEIVYRNNHLGRFSWHGIRSRPKRTNVPRPWSIRA